MDEDAELRERMGELLHGHQLTTIMNLLLGTVVTVIRDLLPPEQRMECVVQFTHALTRYVSAGPDQDDQGQTLQ